MILPPKKVFQNIKIKMNSRTWMTLKSSVVIFQAVQLLQVHWPHLPLQHHWPLQPQKPYFTKLLPGPDGWIIPGTKMTNTGRFWLNESLKIQIFTDILYPFCQRLLRPAYVTFLKNQECISKIYYLSILKLLSNKILLAYFYLSEPIHKVQFNVRYPVSTFVEY